MATEWHHARDGEQFEPIGFDELKRRASVGLLRADDLVWCEGMTGWEPAARISGLIPGKVIEWYYSQGGETLGPVSEVDLKHLALIGQLQPSDLVWSEGEPDWKPASRVFSLFHQPPTVKGKPGPQDIIGRVKEYAASDEVQAMLERTKHVASDVGGKVRAAAVGVGGKVKDASKKAKDYAGSDDAREMLGKASRNFAEAREKVVHSETTKAAMEFGSKIPEKWQENSSILGLPMKVWGYIAALLGLVIVLRLANVASPGVLAVYTVCSLWVYRDARTRLNAPVRWSIGTLVLGPLVMPVYIAYRNLQEGETREGGRAWNVLRCFALFWTITMVFVAFSALGATSEVASTAKNDFEKAGMAIGAGIGFMLLAALWFLPMVAALVLGLFLKKATELERGPTGELTTNHANPLLNKFTFIGVGIVCLFVIGLLSLLTSKASHGDVSGAQGGHDPTIGWSIDKGSDGPTDGKHEDAQPSSPTEMISGPFVYDVGYIQQLKLKYRVGFRDDAIRDMSSNDLQVANLVHPIKVKVINRRSDYTTVRIEEERPELAARGMPHGKTMYVPNPKNW